MLPDHIRREAMRIALHEAGHHVAARALGFRTGAISIELRPANGYRGEASVLLAEGIHTIEQMIGYLERRVIVLYAGCLGESMLCAVSASTPRVDREHAVEIIRKPGNGAEQDHAKARELLHALRNLMHPETDVTSDEAVQQQLDRIDGELFGRAADLVDEHSRSVIRLASAIAGRMPATLPASVRLDEAELDEMQPLREISGRHKTIDQRQAP